MYAETKTIRNEIPIPSPIQKPSLIFSHFDNLVTVLDVDMVIAFLISRIASEFRCSTLFNLGTGCAKRSDFLDAVREESSWDVVRQHFKDRGKGVSSMPLETINNVAMRFPADVVSSGM